MGDPVTPEVPVCVCVCVCVSACLSAETCHGKVLYMISEGSLIPRMKLGCFFEG